MPGMRTLPLFLLLAVACAGPSLVEQGDRDFRLERYPQALQEYLEAAGSHEATGDLARRIRETRYQILAQFARDRLHLEQPREALEVLDLADRFRPGHPDTAVLRRRAARKVGRDYAALGRDFFDDDRPAAAAEAYRKALRWDPENADARVGLRTAEEREAVRQHLGERFYFQGLEEQRDGHIERARTAFLHAASFLGADSGAATHFQALSETLAQRSRNQADSLLAAGLIDAAWLAYRDAQRLAPGHPEVDAQVVKLEKLIRARAALTSTDIALRGMDVERAKSLLQEARRLAGEGLAEALRRADEELRRTDARKRYFLARSYELDRQNVRAMDLYRGLLEERSTDFVDLQQRLAGVTRRVEKAAHAYAQAQEAEARGDAARARELYREALQYAQDYKDSATKAEVGGEE